MSTSIKCPSCKTLFLAEVVVIPGAVIPPVGTKPVEPLPIKITDKELQMARATGAVVWCWPNSLSNDPKMNAVRAALDRADAGTGNVIKNIGLQDNNMIDGYAVPYDFQAYWIAKGYLAKLQELCVGIPGVKIFV